MNLSETGKTWTFSRLASRVDVTCEVIKNFREIAPHTRLKNRLTSLELLRSEKNKNLVLVSAAWSASRSHWWREESFSRRVAQRERSYGTLVYLISALGTGVGIRWSDAMRAAGSLFTSPGISILLEVIFTFQLVRHCRLFPSPKKTTDVWSGICDPCWVYSQVSSAVRSHWADGKGRPFEN